MNILHNPIILNGRLIDDECLHLLIILHPVQLLNVNIKNGSSHLTVLELVEVALQLLQVLGDVDSNINILCGYNKLSEIRDQDDTILPALSLSFFNVSASFTCAWI